MQPMLTDTDLQQIRGEINSALKDYPKRKEMKRGFDTVTKKLNIIIGFFDKEHNALEERVEHIELVLHIV